VVLIVLGVIGSMSKGGSSNPNSTNSSTNSITQNQATPKPQEVMQITATELADDFDANQVSAEQKWENKLVQFSAKISNITDSGLSFTNIGSKQFSMTQISCKIADKNQLLPLKNEQTVQVKGVVGKQTIGVIDLSDCQVVQ
jgi:hypothetical protein